jgi:nitroimidazol reductase NimA-like FMN-containing flavoprotein (pyridoxamine 5'-phosphate oxidase superfamily)
MRRREKEIHSRKVLNELLSTAPVCRIGLASGAPGASLEGENRQDYPYVVPLHFVHDQGRIYIHSARAGKKIEMLKSNPRVCVEIDEFLELKTAEKACAYGTRFRSLIAFGTARIVEAAEQKRRALQLFMKKYTGKSFGFSDREIESVAIIEIRIEEVTGKQG